MSDLDGREHRQIFIETIKSLSVVADNYLTEWKLREEPKKPTIPYPHDGLWSCDCDRRENSHFRCICKQHIYEPYSLQNKITGEIVWIGSDCMKKYLNINKPEHTCLECGLKIRKNKFNLCKKCQVKYIFDFGKHRGKTFHEIYRTEPKYCKWALSEANPTGKLAFFIEWLNFTIFQELCLLNRIPDALRI